MDALHTGFSARWAAGASDVWTTWSETLDLFRAKLATLLGAEPQDICPQPSVSAALTKILFGLPKEPGRNTVLLCREDFPTIGYVLAQAQRFGLELRFIEGGAHLADPAFWEKELDESVHLVHVTHIFSNRGVRTPVPEITALARKRGIKTIIDVAQSAGVVDIDVNDFRADYIIGTSVKYLCGGPGAAWLWANPEAASDNHPIDVGWFSSATPFNYDIETFSYADGAARFMGGTPSVVPFAFAANGIATLLDIGIQAIETYAQSLIDQLVADLPPSVLASHVKPGERGSAVLIKPDNPEAFSKALSQKGIAHDMRTGAVRLSFHVYNDENDLKGLLETLKSCCPV
ncbi:MAG: aminotransferase class V-fold PLP-dependent enzyme [Pseudomonadota bacterium]